MIFVVLILLVLAFLAYRVVDNIVDNPSPWQHSFDGVQFSSDEFYRTVEAAIAKREIPNVRFSRVSYSEGNPLFSSKREYLHVVWGELVYDVCAAPFGTSFFVSAWFVVKPSVTKKLLKKIKGLEQAVESKTYYQADTEAMFKGSFRASLMEAIDAMTNTAGVRTLNELERQFAVGK